MSHVDQSLHAPGFPADLRRFIRDEHKQRGKGPANEVLIESARLSGAGSSCFGD